MSTPERPDRNLAMELVRTTEAAAMASAKWQGRGDKEAGDQAAVDAMRSMLSTVEVEGIVVIGEGEKDEAPMLFNGERVGTCHEHAPQIDIAVDPVDGTTLLSEGRPGALAVIAATARGGMFDPGPAVYMEKMIVGPTAKGMIDLDAPLKRNLDRIARATGKDISEVTVMMLDRPRHDQAKLEIREAGARLQLISDGDVAGGLLAAWDERPGVDLLYGIGGTPEGVSTACGVKALRGEILGRLWPRNDQERSEIVNAGLDLNQVLTTDDLVTTEDAFFACTGITTAQLVDGVTYDSHGAITESLVMRAKSGTIRVIRSRHRVAKMNEVLA
ncbi:MAG: fructose-1,6-bisphosphatase II [Nitriliruptoraceae bacterium]|jgi:fructose-1,6-bisphosphatase II